MTSPAFNPNSSGPALYDSYRYSESYYSARTTEITRQDDNGPSTLRVSVHSAYQYSQTVYTPGNNQSPSVYEAPKRPAIEEFQSKNKPATEEISDTTAEKTHKANLLAFVEQKLQSDLEAGADSDALQARLDEAFEGFSQGYNDGVSLLESMGVFDGDVKDAVQQLYKKMQKGFAELAEKFGLESPVAKAPVAESPTNIVEQVEAPVQLNNAPQKSLSSFVAEKTQSRDASLIQNLLTNPDNYFQAEEAETRSYSFRLRTQDGDFVKIEAFAGAASRYEQASGANASSESFSVAGLENFHFSVRGELDADELSAITDLLGQLNDIADTFFAGDIQGAYEQALNIGYDNDEIARFALNLEQTQYSKLENSYGEVARQDKENFRIAGREQQHPGNRLAEFGDFVELLEKLRQRSERFQLQMAELANFAEFLADKRFKTHPQREHFGPFVHNMGGALERLHGQAPQS